MAQARSWNYSRCSPCVLLRLSPSHLQKKEVSGVKQSSHLLRQCPCPKQTLLVPHLFLLSFSGPMPKSSCSRSLTLFAAAGSTLSPWIDLQGGQRSCLTQNSLVPSWQGREISPFLLPTTRLAGAQLRTASVESRVSAPGMPGEHLAGRLGSFWALGAPLLHPHTSLLPVQCPHCAPSADLCLWHESHSQESCSSPWCLLIFDSTNVLNCRGKCSQPPRVVCT